MAYEPLSTISPVSVTASAPVAPTTSYVPLSSSKAPAPITTPIAPTTVKGGYQPISAVGLLSSVAPVSTTPFAPTVIPSASGPITANEAKGNLGGGYGASSSVDPYSGKPELTYENQAAKSSQLLADRVAPNFDPTIPQKIDPSVLHNGRMPESASEAVRKATGAEPDEDLDHLISLELGGSNDTSNLNNEKLNANGVQPSLTSENAIAKQVASGQISYIDGQKAIARLKGVQLPDDTGYDSSSHPLASNYPKPNSGTAPASAAQAPAST